VQRREGVPHKSAAAPDDDKDDQKGRQFGQRKGLSMQSIPEYLSERLCSACGDKNAADEPDESDQFTSEPLKPALKREHDYQRYQDTIDHKVTRLLYKTAQFVGFVGKLQSGLAADGTGSYQSYQLLGLGLHAGIPMTHLHP
jgi:hypothetical protein